MEDNSPVIENSGRSLTNSTDHSNCLGEKEVCFVPLRLVLQPGDVVLELDRPDMVLGRHSQTDLRLPLPDVSRRHCRFTWSNGIWQVRDLASLNGVYVNGLLVQQAELSQNDLVRIGGFTFSIDLNGSDRASNDAATASSAQGIILASPHLSQPTWQPRKAS